MGKIVFGAFIVIVASSPWFYLLIVGDFPGGNSELEAEVENYKQSLLTERKTIAQYEEKVISFEQDITDLRSKNNFLEEALAKAEGRMKDAEKDVDVLNEQIKSLRGELSDIEQRLLDETNRANTLESVNENIAAQLDSSIQETRRLQTIIRTLSNN
ncbi:MAG: DUF3972 domain-containing protein [Opitutales bacterium]|nr:DUF3972 domain-containing protein [Opitutales bacterium]